MSIEFKLRPWSIKDLPNLVKHANNFNIANNMFDGFPHPYTEEDGKKFIQVIKKSKDLILCIDVNGEAVGSAGIHLKKDIYRKNAEIGYWLAEPFWGQGIITHVVPKLVDYAFEKFDIERLYAIVYGRNTPSQKVLEKNGFELDGRFEKTIFKNEKFEDEMVYAFRRNNWKK